MYRFLLSPRWLGFLLGMLVLATACLGLGRWQLDRLHQRQAINATVAAGQAAAPVPLAELSGAPQEWQRVSASGHYDAGHEVLLRGQLQDGRPGFHVLTPLVADTGPALLVDRGWIPINPAGGATAAPEVPPPAAGEVSVVGRVRLSEQVRTERAARTGGQLQVAAVDVQTLAPSMPFRLYPAYVELIDQQPAVGNSPVLVAAPVADEGPHLAYAIQWCFFGALALFAYGWYARQEGLRRRSAGQPTPAAGDPEDHDGDDGDLDDPAGVRDLAGAGHRGQGRQGLG